MRSSDRPPRARNWTALILSDVQFWIPVIVLCGGLFALWWVQ
jgi:hypothetical protein